MWADEILGHFFEPLLRELQLKAAPMPPLEGIGSKLVSYERWRRRQVDDLYELGI